MQTIKQWGAAALCVLLASGVAFAAARSASEAQALTRASPNSDAPTSAEYLNLDGVKGYRVCVSAEDTRTLSGAGTLQAYVWVHGIDAWVRNEDLDITQDRSAAQHTCFPDVEVTALTGRAFYATSGITVSAGTSVTVRLVGWY